ncbi:MAG: MFS transporter [Myxococcales bacterium]|nr:MFS transporter [Myxococcales bacterium]
MSSAPAREPSAMEHALPIASTHPPLPSQERPSSPHGPGPWGVVAVSALGYFVDVLDLFLFNVFRVPSLHDLGISQDRLLSVGASLINIQMIGLLFGSFFWGILGDRKGRVRALYGSILLYSLATLANALVTSLPGYALCRLLAGLGLAGELGAAIALVSETLPQKQRGLGTALVAGLGLCGGIAAALLAELVTWRTAYVVGGLSGLALLLLRVRLRESSLFHALTALAAPQVQRGSLRLLFSSPRRRSLYIRLVLVGLPVWFVAGILMVFSPELARALDVSGITAGRCILFSYVGTALGDVGSGLLSQALKSRKRVLFLFLLLVAAAVAAFLSAQGVSSTALYALCFVLGVSTGYWAVLVTTAAEHVGTNLRATVSTTIPNVVRASIIPMNLVFSLLLPRLGIRSAALCLGTGCLVLALISLRSLRETFSDDLNFHELP